MNRNNTQRSRHDFERTPSRRSASSAREPKERPREGLLSPAAIVAFVVIAVLAVGGFALWRHFNTPAAPPEEQEEQEQKPRVVIDPQYESKVARLLGDLTLEQKVAQLFVVTPESITGVEAAIAAGETTRDALTEYPVGGIIYNSANLQSPKQTLEMLRSSQNYTKDACGLPLFTCVDEEGGDVARVADKEIFDVVNVGNMANIGATGDSEKARDAAYAIGSYLADLGFNVDFAPVADIVVSDDSVMKSRSFGDTPELVASMVQAQVEGFTRAGVLSSAKHFPGIGSAEGDSHTERIYSHDTAKQMLAWSCVPFKAAIDEQVPMIMVGHLYCVGLESGGNLPASLNPAVIEGLLRDTMGYTGLVITDSLQMEAADVCEDDEQAVLAIQAGNDLVLMPNDFHKAYKGLLKAVKDGEISEERIDESVQRIILAKIRFGL